MCFFFTFFKDFNDDLDKEVLPENQCSMCKIREADWICFDCKSKKLCDICYKNSHAHFTKHDHERANYKPYVPGMPEPIQKSPPLQLQNQIPETTTSEELLAEMMVHTNAITTTAEFIASNFADSMDSILMPPPTCNAQTTTTDSCHIRPISSIAPPSVLANSFRNTPTILASNPIGSSSQDAADLNLADMLSNNLESYLMANMQKMKENLVKAVQPSKKKPNDPVSIT